MAKRKSRWVTSDEHDAALKAFLALSDDEQYEAIDRVLSDLGIFDDEDLLRDDWREILKERGLVCDG